MNILLISGSPSQRSRSELLLRALQQSLQGHQAHTRLVRVRDLPAEALLHAQFNHSAVQTLRQQVASADALIVATPVYKASFAGAIKVLLDLLPERALEHKIVLPIATAGSSAHLLAMEYSLKPVLAALKAQEILSGVFAHDSQITYPQDDRPARFDAALSQRLDESCSQLLSALARRARPMRTSLFESHPIGTPLTA